MTIAPATIVAASSGQRPDGVARTLRCPLCDGTVLITRQARYLGNWRYRAECMYCEYDQIVGLVHDGSGGPKTIVPSRIPVQVQVGELHTPVPRQFKRPHCMVDGCPHDAEEAGLCDSHLSQCRVAGRLFDVVQWIKTLPRQLAGGAQMVKRPTRVEWTADMIKILRDEYPCCDSVDELAHRLGRTYCATQTKARKMGIRRRLFTKRSRHVGKEVEATQ